ncbi:NAD(P)-binding protein [Ceratobasidium sp. AG-I]|nr:NAD(P)-binding protein [Ceratobasidium sp. AG-I]
MPSLSVVRAANLAAAPKYRPVALFLGGTSGVGQAVAEALADVTKGNAHIVISGRNKSAADQIFSKLPNVPPTPSSSAESGSKYEFEACDATLMSNVRQTTQSLLGRLPKLNYLVLTPGFLTLKGRDETSEGMDKKLALNYYARWKFVQDLMPLLEKAKAQGEDARVLTVLAAGSNGKLNVNDLDLKHGYGLKSAADNATAMNDLAVEHFAAQHPDMAFIHAFPGIVRTPLLTNFHWSVRLLGPLVNLFTVSPAECAQWMLYTLLDPHDAKGSIRRNNHAEDVGGNKHSTPELRKLVWEHTLARTSGASN